MTRILVTDGHELAGLATARSLGRAGYDVTVARPSIARRAPVRRSRWVDEVVDAPDPWEEVGRYESWLHQQATSARFDAIFPVSEASMVAADRVIERRAGSPAIVLPDASSRTACLSKHVATAAAAASGLVVPTTALWYQHGAFDDSAISDWPLPFVVKSDNVHTHSDTYRRGRTWVIQDRAQLIQVRTALSGLDCVAIVQQLVPGHGVALSCYAESGTVLAEFAHRRVHEVPWTGGVSSLRASLHDDAIADAGRVLLRELRYTGLAMVEFRQARGGAPHFLEINGRPWGSMALALHAGVDFPRLALERALDPERQHADVASGPRRTVWCMNLVPGELRHLSSIVRDRELSGARRWRVLGRSGFQTARHLADPRLRHDHWWWTDPGPGVAQLGTLARALLGRTTRALPRRGRAPADGGGPGPLGETRSVLWLCSGNICRSPFTERLFAATLEGVRSTSAGLHTTGEATVPDWINGFYAHHGVAWTDHRSQPVTAELIDDHDVVVCMEAVHRQELIRRFPNAASKTWLIGELAEVADAEVADPYVADAVTTAEIFDELAAAVARIAARLASSTAPRSAGPIEEVPS